MLVKAIKFCLLGTFLLGIAGCGYQQSNFDLQLVDIEVVNGTTDMQAPTRFVGGRRTHIDEPFIKVLLSGGPGFYTASTDGRNLIVDAQFCNKEDQFPSVPGFPYPNLASLDVFNNDATLSLDDKAELREKFSALTDKAHLVYHVFVYPFEKLETYPHVSPLQTWNLIEHPHDVCLKLVLTGSIISTTSNTIKISADLLREKLRGL